MNWLLPPLFQKERWYYGNERAIEANRQAKERALFAQFLRYLEGTQSNSWKLVTTWSNFYLSGFCIDMSILAISVRCWFGFGAFFGFHHCLVLDFQIWGKTRRTFFSSITRSSYSNLFSSFYFWLPIHKFKHGAAYAFLFSATFKLSIRLIWGTSDLWRHHLFPSQILVIFNSIPSGAETHMGWTGILCEAAHENETNTAVL